MMIGLDKDADYPSMFEQLPQELVWEIIGKVPESVLQLRLTSRALKWHVDQYTLQLANIHFVDELILFRNRDKELSASSKPKSYVLVKMITSRKKWNLFALWIHLRDLEPARQMFRRGKSVETVICYEYVWDRKDESVPCHMKDYIGKRVGKATLYGFAYDFRRFSILLEDVTFRRLRVDVNIISDKNVQMVLQFMAKHNINQLHLSVSKVSVADPVGLLLHLSLKLKALQITQERRRIVEDYASHFFGLHNADWGPVFLQMMSENLDKLCIENRFYPKFLTEPSADFLIEHLPKIGKKVWFTTTSHAHAQGLDCTDNDHVIEVYGHLGWSQRTMNIKHVSRVKEPFDQL